MSHAWTRFASAALLAVALAADADQSPLSAYLQRYHKLAADDVEGRLQLAAWCAEQKMPTQQIQLLAEVLKLSPDHPTAYTRLVEADAARTLPAERDNAAEHQRLLGARFRLHRSGHFTLLSDMDEEAARFQLDDLEAAYATFYKEVPRLGVRPMPTGERLV